MDRLTLAMDFQPDARDLLKRLRLDPDSEEAEDVLALLNRLGPLGKPKAAALRAAVEEADPETGRVVLGGVEFSGRLLARHLREAGECWPHVITCGRELHDAVQALADPFERYLGEEIMRAGLDQARAALLRRLERDFRTGPMAVMSPGSLLEWSIEQQEPLFRLLAEEAAFTGVELTPTMVMIPNKSVSGILFKGEEGWESCVLCPREKCPDRRAGYDPHF